MNRRLKAALYLTPVTAVVCWLAVFAGAHLAAHYAGRQPTVLEIAIGTAAFVSGFAFIVAAMFLAARGLDMLQ